MRKRFDAYRMRSATGSRWVALALAFAWVVLPACANREQRLALDDAASAQGTVAPASSAEAVARETMVKRQIASRGVRDPRVLAAMRKVPRHEFVPVAARSEAYQDTPLPIGHGQTISQPYIVAAMTELLALEPGDKVLEVGTGSGYQAAVLGELAREVYTIELLAPLAESARITLKRLGYHNVHVRHGNGYEGWPEQAPFDAVIVTAAPPRIPEALKRQLAVGGRLVIPVGERHQELLMLTRSERGFETQRIFPVRFVPMREKAQ